MKKSSILPCNWGLIHSCDNQWQQETCKWIFEHRDIFETHFYFEELPNLDYSYFTYYQTRLVMLLSEIGFNNCIIYIDHLKVNSKYKKL